MTSKVVRFHQAGGPEVLVIEEAEIGAPGPDELKIKVEAIGLNRAEALFRADRYIDRVREYPAVLGYEAAGTVAAVGADVSGFTPGDPVSVIPAFSQNDYGVYAEHALVPASAVVHRPSGTDAVAGASVWMPYITAYGALVEIGGMGPGDTVVLTAASSSVGIAAIQIARRVGATTIATTRSSTKKQHLLDAGADHVVVTDDEPLAERVLEITGGRGAEFVFDPIAGPGVHELAKAVAPGGTLFIYGALSGEPTPYPAMPTMPALNMRTYTLFELTSDPERLRKAERFVVTGLRSGAFRPKVDRTFDFADIVAAHEYLESNAQVGKVVVTVQH